MNTNFNGTQQLNRRRNEQRSAQNSRAWAVATPLCAACQPPNAFGFGGRYRPSCSSRFVRSVAGRTAQEKP
jgi:hypothetical protein